MESSFPMKVCLPFLWDDDDVDMDGICGKANGVWGKDMAKRNDFDLDTKP